jgi:hypothetical protein
MIVCAWCRKALIDKIRDEAALHTSCKGCLVVHTVCDRCLAGLLHSLDAETVARIMAEDSAARHSLPNLALPPKHQLPAHHQLHTRRHDRDRVLAVAGGGKPT